jgi:hypothetical protein
VSSSVAPGKDLTRVPLITDPVSALQALIEFFANRQMLMRDDFLKILLRSQDA